MLDLDVEMENSLTQLKEKLYVSMKEKGLADKDTIKISEELDKLIVEIMEKGNKSDKKI